MIDEMTKLESNQI